MNSKIGKYGALLTGICALVFAMSMILSLVSKDNWNFLSYLSCMILAIGYVIFACCTARGWKKESSPLLERR